MAQARAFLGRGDFARDASVVERGHVNEEAARKSDVAGDARALLSERFLRNLDDDFLARLQQFGDELSAARLTAMMTAAPAERTASATAAIPVASAAARRPLHTGTIIATDARLRGHLGGRRHGRSSSLRDDVFRRRGKFLHSGFGVGFALFGMQFLGGCFFIRIAGSGELFGLMRLLSDFVGFGFRFRSFRFLVLRSFLCASLFGFTLGFFLLGFGDLFGKRGGFFLAQLGRRMRFVMLFGGSGGKFSFNLFRPREGLRFFGVNFLRMDFGFGHGLMSFAQFGSRLRRSFGGRFVGSRFG